MDKGIIGCLISAFLLMTMVVISTAQAASCDGSAYLMHKEKYKAEAGFTPVDNSIIESYAELNCASTSVYLWGVYDNVVKEFNEVDLGISYGVNSGNWRLNAGYERWEYPEGGGDNDVFLGVLGYTGLPVVMKLKWTAVLDETGDLVSLIFAKPIVLGRANGLTWEALPTMRINCTSDYFGSTDCPSNVVYGIKLIAKHKQFKFGLLVDHHDGHGRFSNTTNYGAWVGMDF